MGKKNRVSSVKTILKLERNPFGQYFRDGRDFKETTDKFEREIALFIFRIVQKFNLLTFDLDKAICELLSSQGHGIGAIVLFKMSYEKKAELLDRILRERHHDFNEKKRSDLRGLLKGAGECRNSIVHALYDQNDEGYFYSELEKGDDGLEEKYIKITLEELKEVIDLIDCVIERLKEYQDEWSVL